MTSKMKRRWLQFGLRDLAWLTLVVALGLGWWTSLYRELALSAQNAKMKENISQLTELIAKTEALHTHYRTEREALMHEIIRLDRSVKNAR